MQILVHAQIEQYKILSEDSMHNWGAGLLRVKIIVAESSQEARWMGQ